MKIIFRNFGPLRMCEVELANLVIVTGYNNTGKTYVTHGVFGLLEQWKRLINLPPLNSIASQLLAAREATLDLQMFCGGDFQRQIFSIATAYKAELAKTLASEPARFDATKVDLQIAEELPVGREISLERKLGNDHVVMAKAAGDQQIWFSMISTSSEDVGASPTKVLLLARVLREMVVEELFASYFPRVFISSSERTGAALFQGDLKPKRIDPLQNENSDERPEILTEGDTAPAYALAVQRSIEFLSSAYLQRIQRQPGVLMTDRPDISAALDEITKGSFKVTPDGTFFVPNGDGAPNLRLGESSSSVRSLLDVAYYIRFVLRPGDCFMIDEPELNLHPHNQRLVARLIGRLVNAGVKVFITTHSDYIIRELNTLIVLAGRKNTQAQLLQELGYDAKELVAASGVRFYRTANEPNQDLEQTPVDASKGIEVKSFDEVIDRLNEVQDAIIYTPETQEAAEKDDE
jgi:hypothetical protein